MPRQSIVQFEYPAKKCSHNLLLLLVKIFAQIRTTISNCYWTSFLLMPFASLLSIFLNETIRRQDKNLIKRIFWVMPLLRKYYFLYYEQLSLFLLYFRPLFITCYTTAHTASSSRVDWCRIGCLWKEEKMSSKSLQFLIHLSKHCNWIVNKKTSRYQPG